MTDDTREGAKGKTRHVGRRHQGDPENYEDHLNGAPDDYGERQPLENEPGAPRLRFHPAAEKFPLMNAAELQALAADIKEHGLRHKIETLDDGDGPMILDGRNRYNACLIAGVEPSFRVLSDNINPRDHLISKNLTRRHSTELQRALYAARLVTADHGGDRRSFKAASCGLEIVTRADAARRIGVSEHAVERALFILDPDHSAVEFVTATDAGIPWLTLGYAHKIAHAEKEDQRLWLHNHKHAIKPVKRARKAPKTPIPITGNGLNALSDLEALVVFEKLRPKINRALKLEGKTLAIVDLTMKEAKT